MRAISRVGREYVAQVVAFLVALSDRLIIPAVFLRTLGVANFSGWSIAVASGAFVSVLEFGVTRYFTNELIALIERREFDRARSVFRHATTMIIVLAVAALIAIAIGFRFLVKGVGDPRVDAQLWLVAVPVTLAAAVLQLIAIRQVLYRAHRHFALETWIRCAGEGARILTAAGIALAGGQLVTVGWGWLAATVLFLFVPFYLHTRISYPSFGGGAAVPGRSERRVLFMAAPGLWLQSMFMTLYASIPVFAIGLLSPSAGVIAQFVLMRTIANFVRQILQMFANVFGIELARRYALKDIAGFANVFRETNRFLAVQTAVGSAALIVLARPLFTVWTGHGDLFDPRLLLFAILPPLLTPSTMLSIEAFAYANNPWPVVRARVIQAALSVAAFVVLPVPEPGYRMMIALALGEIGGLGAPLVRRLRDLNPLLGWRDALELLMRSGVAFAGTFALLEAGQMLPVRGTVPTLTVGAVLALLAFGMAMLSLGLSSERRRDLTQAIKSRL